jgi:hypothetical protein
MRDRMAMSYFKYGAVRDAFPHKVSALESLRARIEKYEDTGNTEWLIDAANFAMIEFMLPCHKRAHYKATDSSESPGRFAVASEDGFTAAPNRELEAL